MTDPLSEVISILRPHAPVSKLVHAASPFRVRRDDLDDVFYCLMLAGKACLEVDGREPLYLSRGDFTLIPALQSFSFSSIEPRPLKTVSNQPVLGEDGIYRLGSALVHSDVQVLVGHCSFVSPDTELLVSLMPDMVLVHGEERLGTLASLLRDEIRADRPARDAVAEHLLQVLLIEAFRSTTTPSSSSGLLRGLADPRIGQTIRAIHTSPNQDWTIPELASTAQLSRSAFFTRFNRVVGVTPIGYLLNWRMTIAKHLLRDGQHGIAEISEKIGYGSASAFSTAFTRHVGTPPSNFSKGSE